MAYATAGASAPGLSEPTRDSNLVLACLPRAGLRPSAAWRPVSLSVVPGLADPVSPQGELRISVLPAYLSYDAPWPVRKIPLRCTAHYVAYHVESKV